MKTYKKTISAVSWLVGALALWEIVAYILSDILCDPLAAKKVPKLGEIIFAFSGFGPQLIHQAGITLSYAAAGFAIGAAVGIILALIMSLSGLCEKMILPYLLISQMIPILGLAPILFGLFKSIDTTRRVIAAYITFFPVSVNLLSGLKAADPNARTMMRAYAAGTTKTYLKLLIPSSLPYLFTGLKIAAPMAIAAAILVDTLSAKDGIGYVIIYTLYGGGTTGQFWPAVILAALMGTASFFVVSAAEWLFIPWKRSKFE